MVLGIPRGMNGDWRGSQNLIYLVLYIYFHILSFLSYLAPNYVEMVMILAPHIKTSAF